jgi:hypothetical protein
MIRTRRREAPNFFRNVWILFLQHIELQKFAHAVGGEFAIRKFTTRS